jgi:hypothetical protein
VQAAERFVDVVGSSIRIVISVVHLIPKYIEPLPLGESVRFFKYVLGCSKAWFRHTEYEVEN